jgi:hypothetical protein
MYSFERFKAEHIFEMEVHESQSFKLDGTTKEECLEAYKQAESFDKFVIPQTIKHNQKIIACMGLLNLSPWRGEVWSVMGKYSGDHMVCITREAKNMIEEAQEHGVHRLESIVDMDFKEGHKWMTLLGFTPDGILRCYNQNKSDVLMYSKVVK